MPKSLLPNLGPNAPKETNELGGQGSKVDVDFTLLDPVALMELLKVIGLGAKRYAKDNWRLVPVDVHVNHMLIHAFAYLDGDTQDDHLEHMLCRAFMAVAKAKRPNYFGAMTQHVEALQKKLEAKRKRNGNKKRQGQRLGDRQSR